jgi:hypothetical protein
MGTYEGKVLGYVSNILGPDRESPVVEDEIYMEDLGEFTGRSLTLNVSFYRLSPLTGFDVAIWMHEKTKFLEESLYNVRPEQIIDKEMSKWIRKNAKTTYQSRKALEHLERVFTKYEYRRAW